VKRVVVRVPTVVAGLLFLVSVLNPFVSAEVYGLIGGRLFVRGKLWSFKGDLVLTELIGPWPEARSNVSTEQKWFADYWGFSDAYYSNGLVRMENYGLSLLVLVFITQIGTLAFAAASLLYRRFERILLLCAAVFGSLTILGMCLFSSGLQSFSLEPGFWLALGSAVLFLATLIASRIMRV